MRRRLLLEWYAITLATVVLVAGLVIGEVTSRVDNIFYNSLVGFYAPHPSDKILLVAVDDHSLAQLGRWPWSRTVHAEMLERLKPARPAAVAYDVLFTEHGAPVADTRLATAIRSLGKVSLPVLFEVPGHDDSPIEAVPPVAPIGTAARSLGQVALQPDSDGVARSILLQLSVDQREWPHLMGMAYRTAMGHPSPAYARAAASGDWSVRVPFQPHAGQFRTVSFSSLLAGEVPDSFVRDHIVLVGVTAAGLGDRYNVPMRSAGEVSGLEVQANLLNALLTDRVLFTAALPIRLLAALAPSLLLLTAFWFLRPARVSFISLLLVGHVLALPPLLLAVSDIWLPPMPALIGLFVAYPLWGWRRLHILQQEIDQELLAFAGEPSEIALDPREFDLDPIGSQTVRLRQSIATMRDLRRLVSDTIESVADPLLVTDLDDAIVLANRPTAALSGKPLVGLRAAALLSEISGVAVSPDALPDELNVGERVFSLRRSPLRDSEGAQRGWILQLQELTAVRAAESEREAALQFLSHDMRSPQSSIISLLEQYRDAIDHPDLAERITALAWRTLTLADNFVQLARVEAAAFAPEEVDLGEILTEAADDLWSQASKRKVRIMLDGVDMPHYVLAEHNTLRRALVNLIDNAVKFSPESGVVHCSVAAVDEGRYVECVIADEGPGMSAERRANPFRRYGAQQAAPGSSYSVGLGLAYVGAAVARHGGEITCAANEPRGTRFTLRFPAVA